MGEIARSEIQYIDIDQVLAKRNPKLKKVLPQFAINYIKKIAHQDDINKFLDVHGTKIGRDFIDAILDEFSIKTEIIGKDNLPPSGKFIFAANHPLGGIDGAALIHNIGHIYPDIKTITNDLLLNVKNLETVFVGVNSFGKNTREHLLGLNQMFDSDAQILIFPSGLVSRRKKGVIMDLEWKKTFIDWARKYKRNVIPVHFSGRVSNFFYTFANIRKLLGIKVNLEMFYLADEMYKYKGEKIKITIGKPIHYEVFDSSKRSLVWAGLMRKHIYDLAKNPLVEFVS